MSQKKIPIRTCIGCRNEFPKNELVRIVRSDDGVIFIDAGGKANGRGAYFCGSPVCIKKIRKARMLDRAFGTTVPDEVYSRLEEETVGKKE